MAIAFGNRTVAETTFRAVYGVRAAGAYLVRFSLVFSAYHWTPQKESFPLASVGGAIVSLEENGQVLQLGLATPETCAPFRVGAQGTHHVLFDLLVGTAAMEAIERVRNGMSVIFHARVPVTMTTSDELVPAFEHVLCRVPQSDWLEVLRECGYRQTFVIEIALPEETKVGEGHAVHHLEKARTHMLRGHYGEAVAACRLALEEWTARRQEETATAAASKLQKTAPRELDAKQRELLLRVAAINYAHLAHHPNVGDLATVFDRDSAIMMIGITASMLRRPG